MQVLKVLAHPVDEVIFEDAFDQLMQQIGCDQFVNIRPWEVRRVGLASLSVNKYSWEKTCTVAPVAIPYDFRKVSSSCIPMRTSV